MFKLQSPSKYSPFDAMHLSRRFFSTAPKQLLDLLILMPFSASAVFCFTSSHVSKLFPFEDFFSSGETKQKSLGARSGEQGGWSTGVMLFLVKNC